MDGKSINAGETSHIDDMWNASLIQQTKESPPDQIMKKVSEEIIEKKETKEAVKEILTNEKEGEETSEGKEEAPSTEKSQEKTDAENLVKAQDLIKGMMGDKIVDLSPDTVFEVKVDRKVIKVPLKDMMVNYSGKVSWDKKFSELSEDKKSYQADKGKVMGIINSFYTKAQGKDYMGALALLAEAGGLDPVKFIKSFNSELRKNASDWSKMSPDQQQVYDAQLENQFLQEKNKTILNDYERRSKLEETQKELENIMTTTGASREDLLELTEEAERSGYPDITPKELGEIFILRKNESLIGSVVNETLGSAEDAVQKKATAHLSQVLKMNPDFNIKDLKDIVFEIYTSDEQKTKYNKAKNLSAKVRKTQPLEKQDDIIKNLKALTFDDL